MRLVPAVVTAVLLPIKFFFEMSSGKSAKLRDDYRFAKEFLKDISDDELHPYLVEKGYQALAGVTDISVKEVEYILTLDNSVSCLRDYVLSKKYLDKLETSGSLKLKFKDKYQSRYSRLWRQIIYFICYSFLAFSALIPLTLDNILGLSKLESLGLLLVTLPTLGIPAWLFLKGTVKISRAQKLVKDQSKYTKSVIVQT